MSQHEEYERCLFVGGPAHLDERNVERRLTHCEVAEQPRDLPRYMRDDGMAPVMMTCEIHIYRKIGKAAGLVIMEYVNDRSKS